MHVETATTTSFPNSAVARAWRVPARVSTQISARTREHTASPAADRSAMGLLPCRPLAADRGPKPTSVATQQPAPPASAQRSTPTLSPVSARHSVQSARAVSASGESWHALVERERETRTHRRTHRHACCYEAHRPDRNLTYIRHYHRELLRRFDMHTRTLTYARARAHARDRCFCTGQWRYA